MNEGNRRIVCSMEQLERTQNYIADNNIYFFHQRKEVVRQRVFDAIIGFIIEALNNKEIEHMGTMGFTCMFDQQDEALHVTFHVDPALNADAEFDAFENVDSILRRVNPMG
jgi:hypothetical protein